MAVFRRVYDSPHMQADCQAPRSAPEPCARQSNMGYLYLILSKLRWLSECIALIVYTVAAWTVWKYEHSYWPLIIDRMMMSPKTVEKHKLNRTSKRAMLCRDKEVEIRRNQRTGKWVGMVSSGLLARHPLTYKSLTSHPGHNFYRVTYKQRE